MMNQAASATGRPAGSTATAGCCPMFNAPFFVNTFAPQTSLVPPPSVARQCFLGPQTNQLQIPTIQPPPQQHSVATSQSINHHHNHQHPQQQPPQPAAPSNGSDNFQQISSQQQQQQHHHQQQPIRSQDHTNNYNTTSSLGAPGLSLQHLRHSASNCMALAAALASASFPTHFQQLQQAQQQHLQTTTPINSTTNSSNLPNPVPSAPINVATANAATTQVPLLNFNSYNVAQPFLNLPAPPAPPPLAAHLNLSSRNNTTHTNNNHNTSNNSNNTHQSNGTTNFTSATNQPTVVQPVSLANTGNLSQTVVQAPPQPQHRPLGTNTTLNSAANQPQQQQQQQPANYRSSATTTTTLPSIPLAPPQQLGHVTRSILSDEALNSLFNDQFQAMLLNQLFANQQFAPSVTVPAQQPQQQASSNTARPLQQQQHQNGASQVVMPSAQQVATPVVPQQQVQEPVSGQQQTYQPQQATAQPRLAQVPNPDSYTSSGITNNNNYHQHHTSSVNHNQSNSDSVPQNQQQQPPLQPSQQPQHQQQQVPQPQPQPQQQQQSQQQTQQQSQQQHTIPPLFYSSPQMEQALALLANPQVANNIFSHIFNAMYMQNNIRTETHQTQHHHQAHHFHHHLHGAHHHHHHHHGANGQPNGQDVTMPLDSLAISESKPRGLNRAEIDSLTPYIHINEKDARTCVICLSKFELKAKIRPLPCNHAFHAKCVDKWLRANRTCPICRRDALKTFNAKIKRI